MPIINSSLFASGGTDTSNATATAADILSGKTAYIATGKVIGTMPTQGAQTITPGTNNKTIQSDRYLSGTQTILGSSQLVPENIKSGVNIFGVTGTYSIKYYNLDSGITFNYGNNQIIIPGTWTYVFGKINSNNGGVALFYCPNKFGNLLTCSTTEMSNLTKTISSNQTILTSSTSFSIMIPDEVSFVDAYVL